MQTRPLQGRDSIVNSTLMGIRFWSLLRTRRQYCRNWSYLRRSINEYVIIGVYGLNEPIPNSGLNSDEIIIYIYVVVLLWINSWPLPDRTVDSHFPLPCTYSRVLALWRLLPYDGSRLGPQLFTIGYGHTFAHLVSWRLNINRFRKSTAAVVIPAWLSCLRVTESSLLLPIELQHALPTYTPHPTEQAQRDLWESTHIVCVLP